MKFLKLVLAVALIAMSSITIADEYSTMQPKYEYILDGRTVVEFVPISNPNMICVSVKGSESLQCFERNGYDFSDSHNASYNSYLKN